MKSLLAAGASDGSMKRIPTFSALRRELGLDPPPDAAAQDSPATRARFSQSWERLFREEWGRLRLAVAHIVAAQELSQKQFSPCPFLKPGQLHALHQDIHVLLLSQAGAFIFEFYQNTLLPGPLEQLLTNILKDKDNFTENLTKAWYLFYCHMLPALEAIFVQVKNHLLTLRQASLLGFRDHVVLPLYSQIEELLSDESSVPPLLKQMLLVLQGVTEIYPPSKQKLQLESLVARAVSPYLGHKGLYEMKNELPTQPSRELEVAHLRRPSLVDPRRLSRPLSVNSSRNIETLNELFVLSANRMLNRTKTPVRTYV